jgi:hypothetical protein
MVTCPRCEQPVDETVRNTCPLCFTPLEPQANAQQTQPGAAQNVGMPGAPNRQAQPLAAPSLSASAPPLGGASAQPTAMPLNGQPLGAPAQPAAVPLNASSAAPLRNPNTRMTLNGDIIEAPPSQAQAAPTIGNSPAARPAAPRPAYGVAPRKQEASRSAGSTATLVVVVLLVLCLGGFGGYYYMMHRTNPKDQVQKYLSAIKTQDYKTIYEVMEQTEEAKAKYKDAQDFADQTKSMVATSPYGSALVTIESGMTFTIKDAKDNNGSTATVPTTMSISAGGKTYNVDMDLKMKNFNGIWKVSTDTKIPGMGGGMPGGSFGSAGGGR